MLQRAGIACRIFEVAPELKAGRRRHQHPAARVARTVRARARGGAGQGGRHTREYCFFNRFGRYIYSEPAGACRLRRAAVLHPSRRSADGAARGFRRARRRRRRDRRLACTRVDAATGDRAFRGSRTAGSCRRSAARRIALRGHPFGRAQATLSRRRAAEILRHQHVARRHALAADSVGREHDARRLAPPAKMVHLPDPQRDRRAKAASSSTGCARSRRRITSSATGTRPGRLEDFIGAIADWHFDWLDVPQFIRSADAHPRISDGRPGSAAALELRPRDAAGRRRASDVSARLQRRGAGDPRCPRARRRAGRATTIRSRRSRPTKTSGCRRPARWCSPIASAPPDAILQEVYRRTGDKPFERIEDVISREELVALSESYKRVAGYDKERLKVSGLA